MHISYSIFHLSSGEAITVFLLLYPGDCAAYFLLLIFSTLTPKKGHFSNFFEQGKTIKGVVWGLKGQVKGEPFVPHSLLNLWRCNITVLNASSDP